MDGIDAAVVEFGDHQCRVVHAITHPYPKTLAQALRRCIDEPEQIGLSELGELDAWCGDAFGDAVIGLLNAAGLAAARITAVGSHGQTVFHRPDGPRGFSLQIGDPARIAARCGITVVANFRQADIALGGQGAPLAPAFHAWAFASSAEDRAVVNIGGIGNVTLLPRTGDAAGFDTGPGNTLLDAWYTRHRGHPFDTDGAWAASGQADNALLLDMLDDPYFRRDPPKSTGREYFHERWLQAALSRRGTVLRAQDVQATLAELTARTIAEPIAKTGTTAVAICGGGALNTDLMLRLQRLLPGARVASTREWGLDPEWVEAATFAWLARERLANRPNNLPTVTGASRATSMGAVHQLI
jgi:anhydro-N-acetylmuramic acid kinase